MIDSPLTIFDKLQAEVNIYFYLKDYYSKTNIIKEKRSELRSNFLSV